MCSKPHLESISSKDFENFYGLQHRGDAFCMCRLARMFWGRLLLMPSSDRYTAPY
jgi:hypothetical protein